MELCSNGHDEVCYDCRECPVCTAQEEIDSLEEDLQEANEMISSLEAQVE